MADSTTPFTNSEWNQIIIDINALAELCEGVEPLVEIEECHRLTITDITDAQEKLVELCEDHEFTTPEPPDAKWLQSAIQEIEDAIEVGSCCCEETNWNPTKPLLHYDYFFRFVNLSGGTTQFTTDWAAWMGQEDPAYPLVITEVECIDPENPEDPPTTIEVREGGRFWVGSEFKFWDLYIFMGNGTEPSTAPTGPVRLTGDVVDGYIVLPPSLGGLNPTCTEDATADGFDLGEKDPLFGFPFTLDGFTASTETVGGANGYSNTFPVGPPDYDYPDGQMIPDNGGDTMWTWDDNNFYIANVGSDITGWFFPFIRDIQGRVTLRCE